MKPRTLLVLLVLVLGLGSYIWFYDREQPSSEERAELEKKAIPIKKDEVTAVSLQSGAGTVRLEKASLPAPKKKEANEEESEELTEAPVEWRIVEPLKARADTALVDGLLDALASLDTVRKLDAVNPKEVGLDRPRATVRVKTADGEKVLKIGAEIPTSGTTIAALESGKGAVVVSDSVLTEIRRKPGDWRDRQIYRGDRDHVQRITLVSGGQRVVLAKQGDSFRIESPFKDRADRDKMDDLFAELSGLTAERFLDGGEPIQPQAPLAVVEVVSDEAPPFRIELGAQVETPAPSPETEDPTSSAKTWQARSGGQLFEVRTRLEAAAARPAAEWRATSLSSLETYDVESVTVQDGQGTISLTRSEPDWKRGKETISYLPVSDFLFSLVGAKADRLLTPGEAVAVGIVSGGKPMMTVILGTKSKGQETLKLYAPVAAGVPATASDRELILMLPPGMLGEIQGKLADVRKAKPVDSSKQ